jgi:hypothetical protein
MKKTYKIVHGNTYGLCRWPSYRAVHFTIQKPLPSFLIVAYPSCVGGIQEAFIRRMFSVAYYTETMDFKTPTSTTVFVLWLDILAIPESYVT